VTALQSARPVLAGVRIVDLTRLLPGNYASLLLRGLGAEVIKVEELHGDGTRANPPFTESGESGSHVVLNRGKRSIAINLKTPQGRSVLLDLVASADVLLDSFRPGVLERLDLGPEVLSANNAHLVHVSLTAFGSEGPLAQVPSHDLNAQSLAGILAQSADGSGRPNMPAVPIADMATGLQAALAVMAGLRAIEHDGDSYRAEIAMLDSALSLSALAAGYVVADGQAPPTPGMLSGALACYDVYQCADRRWLSVAALEPKFFTRLCELIDEPQLAQLQYQLDQQHELRTALTEVFARKSRDDWAQLLLTEDTCVTPIKDLREAFEFDDPQQRGVITAAETVNGHVAPVIAAVPWLPEHETWSAPRLSADAEAILAELNYGSEQVSRLRDEGIVGGLS
jgi:alpha-methylacyl-CoA racemase